MYEQDPATNCLPSMHVGLSFYSARTLFHQDKRMGLLIFCGIPFIWYSTLALKQHWFLDGALGIAMALLIERFMSWKVPWKEEEHQFLPRWNHLYWFVPAILIELACIIHYTMRF